MVGSGIQRRLAAIFCADVADYTRLVRSDERGTLGLLAVRRELATRQVEQHGGRVANTAGDSILAEFPNALDAVQCAVAVQELVEAANEPLAEDGRLRFRIGIHVGEALVRGGDLFGDAVNIAARLESVAAPGTVCVSEAAHAYVHALLAVTFEDLGPQKVRNVHAPVRAFLIRPDVRAGDQILPAHRNEFNLVRQLNQICFQALEAVAAGEALQASDVAVLAAVTEAPGVTLGQLAANVGIDAAAVGEALTRLRTRELIEPAVGGAGVQPTPVGFEIRKRVRPAFSAAQDRVLGCLGPAERQLWKDLMIRVVRANRAAP